MLTITRQFKFDAAHRLFLKNLTHRENHDIFGKCSKVHGHTYCLKITISGKVQPTGMILNFTDLKRIVETRIIDRYDHSFLNDLDEYKDLPTTAENMALYIFKALSPCLKSRDLTLTRVVLYETPDSWATVTSDV
ncbi:6-pyruvoyltetrahydropterin/6-carboxytetrahydropterin synthase [Desulfocicer vacuolatum DSM 3385]|uniref:6-carboxy-5,6,7,8-tetrahydropterin synthase n=1 Tax=Desulfocicer vacuolatum DSM 3385 TaxID=1121400 RepID=A0A1W2A6Z1_9BACT|nr:6-carboxytetrahydropterin synthase [Desulfocicer vacuolatum]SMC56444.1 6-pyruvoyltetrahydropterin/6-carboxytetrahydropterin synthase [Desulfocicer vacuolatum DSM 3385]